MYPLVRPALQPESGWGDHAEMIHRVSMSEVYFLHRGADVWPAVCSTLCYSFCNKVPKLYTAKNGLELLIPQPPPPRALPLHDCPDNHMWFLWNGTQRFMNPRHKPRAQTKSLKRLSKCTKMCPNHIYLVRRHKQQVAWHLAYQLWQTAQRLNISERGKPFHYKLLNGYFQPEEGHTTCSIPS